MWTSSEVDIWLSRQSIRQEILRFFFNSISDFQKISFFIKSVFSKNPSFFEKQILYVLEKSYFWSYIVVLSFVMLTKQCDKPNIWNHWSPFENWPVIRAASVFISSGKFWLCCGFGTEFRFPNAPNLSFQIWAENLQRSPKFFLECSYIWSQSRQTLSQIFLPVLRLTDVAHFQSLLRTLTPVVHFVDRNSAGN